jgi:glycosyltransferase involved in cell wall biosynthesis
LDTDEHRTLLPLHTRGKAVVVPVGAPDAWFAAAASTAAARPATDDAVLRVVFFGLFTPLQGAGIIGEALGKLSDRPDIAVTMIGAGQDYPVTRASAVANKSVTWIDWVEPADLPGIVARHDVCLGIFGSAPKAGRVVPNKVYQGAAAGCAIVTSDTAPQRRTLGDAAAYVPAGDASGLAQALRHLADNPARLNELRAAARSLAVSRFTASAIVEPLCDRLAR